MLNPGDQAHPDSFASVGKNMQATLGKHIFIPPVVSDGVQRAWTFHPSPGNDILIVQMQMYLYGYNKPDPNRFGYACIQKNAESTLDQIGIVILFFGQGQQFIARDYPYPLSLKANEKLLIEEYADVGSPWTGLMPVFDVMWIPAE